MTSLRSFSHLSLAEPVSSKQTSPFSGPLRHCRRIWRTRTVPRKIQGIDPGHRGRGTLGAHLLVWQM